ncbi:hypothetical protein NDN08_000876 [Rhodosorus marinus]|uniref:FF domain-containing protein n=1 Tax=Rhodosorus marinus TaxID=101924 RepID=A0AAV8UP76_9RHOD|nr:hypothetical protein NDN08_000876 [Rhodosorus marinus]
MELNLGEEQGTGNVRSDEGGVRHSNQFLETYYQQLQDRPARKTWEDFKKDKQSNLEKSAGGSDMARYRRELDKDREAFLAKKLKEGKESKKSKKEKKEKKEKREKKEKKSKKEKREKRGKRARSISPPAREKRRRRADDSD